MAAHAVEEAIEQDGSSRVRTRSGAREGLHSRAERRVAEYLRALGLCDAVRLDALTQEITASCAAHDDHDDGSAPPERVVERAVAEAQTRYETFLERVFGPDSASVDPLWLRAFISERPEHFLGDVEAARAAAQGFGDPWQGAPPASAHFRPQSLRRARLPRWLRPALVPALITLFAVVSMSRGLGARGVQLFELCWLLSFTFLLALGSVGAQIALLGLRAKRAQRSAPESGDEALPRSVVCVPIHEEDAERVFAALAAMRESLAATAGGDAFEIFVLSDSRRPAQVAEEERAFRRVAAAAGTVPLYYRRRARNTQHKAGNIAEFFERWGDRYRYAVVLDADSLMTGETLVTLVRRMHASPRLAILQAPLVLRGGRSLFARAQQFAASVCGPLFMRGLARWAGPHGNYYGHNAVLRVEAFMECCALPRLAGEPPLGGDILSHDFVEAALLCRAGWEVRMADDLDGSWEELPADLPAHVIRDRRWCQGNLQHLRVALAEGLAPMSRVHLLLGAACYLAGPVWLFFVVLSALHAGAGLSVVASIASVSLATLLLVLPRVLGVATTLADPVRRAQHGGAVRLLLSAVLEAIFATLITPLLMLHHTVMVAAIIAGKPVSWLPQARRGAGKLRRNVRSELPATLLGAAALLVLLVYGHAQLLWLAPIWVPCLLAIPTALLAASTRVGGLARRLGLLAVPSETAPHELFARSAELRALTSGDASARFRDLVLDPRLIAAHVAALRPAENPAASDSLIRLRERALRVGPAALRDEERQRLSADAESMRWLHREAWRHWPVESWGLAREHPQLPRAS